MMNSVSPPISLEKSPGMPELRMYFKQRHSRQTTVNPVTLLIGTQALPDIPEIPEKEDTWPGENFENCDCLKKGVQREK